MATPEAVAPFALGAGVVATADNAEALGAPVEPVADGGGRTRRLAQRALQEIAAYGAEAQRRRLEALVAEARECA